MRFCIGLRPNRFFSSALENVGSKCWITRSWHELTTLFLFGPKGGLLGYLIFLADELTGPILLERNFSVNFHVGDD